MKIVQKRTPARLLCLWGALCPLLVTGACRLAPDTGVPPSPAQHLQEIMNNPHIPQSIKDAAQRQAQAQQPPAGAQQTVPKGH